MTAKTTEMTLNDGKDDKKDGKDDGERLAWCDDLTCGFILALLSAYWQHRPMFELVFVAYGHFYCRPITNEQVPAVRQNVVNIILFTLHSFFHSSIEAEVNASVC